MGRKNRPGKGDDDTPRRGLRRSIRVDAHDAEANGARPRTRPADAPPTIQLRRLLADAALERLVVSLQAYRHLGRLEVLVVHGRGLNSPGGRPVIGPLVRQWCADHPAVVAATREAPPAWGGEGALVVTLRPER
ncbi:MAG: Smr/MutS family protein [Candidatus Krumholzibacteriia bacterium]